MNRARYVGQVVRGLARHPKAMARVAHDLNGAAGWNSGRALAEVIDASGRRRAAAALLRDEGVVVRFRHGEFEWNVPSGDLILAEMLSTGRYESEEIPPLCRWVEQHRPRAAHPVVVEVGANVGTSTIPFCRSGYRVVAFEPVPRIRALLEENLAANGFADEVTVLPYAVAANDGSAQMRESDAGGSELVSASVEDIERRRGRDYFVGRQATSDSQRTLSVPTRTLEGTLSESGVTPDEVAFVWSDTEGAETGVITGGRALWAQGVPLWLEVWPAGLDEHGGLDGFTSAVREGFAGYIERDALLADGTAARLRPAGELGPALHRMMESGPVWASTDLLLVPHELLHHGSTA